MLSRTNNPIILKGIWGPEIEQSRDYHVKESIRKRIAFELAKNGKKK